MTTVDSVCEKCGKPYKHETSEWAYRDGVAASGCNGNNCRWYGEDGVIWPEGTFELRVEKIYSPDCRHDFCDDCFNAYWAERQRIRETYLMPCPPSDFSELDAGEHWGENDY